MNMQRPLIGIALTALVSAMSACAPARELVISQPVGPAHDVLANSDGLGRLVVYSAWDRFDTLDSEHPRHTPYKVTSDKGTTVARVHNQAGSFGQDPVVLSVHAGRYWVEARATNVGLVRVPIVIREGRSTSVYLDGTTAPEPPREAEDNYIRQPNGLIVGWKDNGDNP